MTKPFKYHQTKLPKHIRRELRQEKQMENKQKPKKTFYKKEWYEKGYRVPLSLLRSKKVVELELQHYLTMKERQMFCSGVGKYKIIT